MMRSSLTLVLALLLVLAACGEGADEAPEDAVQDPPADEPDEEPDEAQEPEEAAPGLDCANIEAWVPYGPGGGSDRQVRRLEPHLSEILDTNINIVNREGAAGATAWTALADAEPDGCTVANVVVPNILISAEVDDAPFSADDFSYFGFTEASPNAITVQLESEFEDIEQFLEAARDNPGELMVAGSGQGPMATNQFMEATGVDVTFIPMEGGASDGLANVQGGHVDAVNFAASHVLANEDTVRALALSGSERSPALPDIPTLDELGYEGFTIVALWGLIGPPGVPDEVMQVWNEALVEANERTEEDLLAEGLSPLYTDLDETVTTLEEQTATFDPEDFR
jgi:tripartite-type tricarboxylate transporter receptor subunit TctC